MMGYYANQRTEQALIRYEKLAKSLNMTLTQLSLAFVNDRPFVGSNIIGATSMEQLAENISSAHLSLPEDALNEIDQIFIDFPNPGNY